MADIAKSIKTKANFEQLGSVYTFSGALEKTNDSDWIRIQVSQGVTYKFFASFTETDTREFGESQISLFNSSSQTIVPTSYTNYSSGPALTFTAAADGFVYLEIHQINPILQTSGTYSIFAGANLPTAVAPGGSNAETYTSLGNEVVTGGLLGDLLTAGTTNSVVLGQGGNDTIYGASNGVGNILSGGHGDDTIYTGFNATGTVLLGDGGNDELYGSLNADAMVGGTGNDYLDGGLGNDNLTGGGGRDVLIGGANDDRFIFNSAKDSVSGRARDFIRDFSAGDKIDLQAIDAKPGGSDQAFTFIGTKAFHHKVGELRVQYKGAALTIVQGDINGDGKADFEIGLLGHHVLSGAIDFDL